MQEITISDRIKLFLPEGYQKTVASSFNVKKWTKALRSGIYPMGKMYLEKNGKFCCLGVLCKTKSMKTNLGGLTAYHHPKQYKELGFGGLFPEGVYVKIFETVDNDYKFLTLSSINDYGVANFHDIATIIETVWTN